jgi:hypothetical protein
MKITLAGQDITPYVDEKTIDIKDALGQGAGNAAGQSGRAATAEFNVQGLGPYYTALGAGTVPTSPCLVRMGAVAIYSDNAGTNLIFGGYASNMEDVATSKTEQSQIVKIDCYDYWQHLDRVYVNEVFDGQTDIQIITYLIQKYASWVSLSELPVVAAYQFGPIYFRNTSLQKALQRVADTTGYAVWITPQKVLYYTLPTQSLPAPFALSDNPNFVGSFSMKVTDFTWDDTSAINRVYFFGGKVAPDANYTQDLSMFANGNNTTFPLAYYPRSATDGKIHVNINGGPDLVLGSATGVTTGPNTQYVDSKGQLIGTNPADNILKPAGLADVLINYDAHTLLFAYAPASGSTVTCTYRYEAPLVVTITDQSAYQFWGMYLDGSISDNTVFDKTQATQRCQVLLREQSRGLGTLKVTTWKPGLASGQVIRVDHNVKDIHDYFLIQEVETHIGSDSPGAGIFQYDLTLGAWDWNMHDVINALAWQASGTDSNTDETVGQIQVAENYYNTNAALAFTTRTWTSGGVFYSRSAPVGDGHDAYAGFFTVQKGS